MDRLQITGVQVAQCQKEHKRKSLKQTALGKHFYSSEMYAKRILLVQHKKKKKRAGEDCLLIFKTFLEYLGFDSTEENH